jgi:hypothetical protein
MRESDISTIRADNRAIAKDAGTLLENAILKALQSGGDITRISITVGVAGPKLLKPKCSLEMRKL